MSTVRLREISIFLNPVEIVHFGVDVAEFAVDMWNALEVWDLFRDSDKLSRIC